MIIYKTDITAVAIDVWREQKAKAVIFIYCSVL